MTNFRCYESTSFEFNERLNIIVGQNAIGKTSIVESINVLCLGKTFKDVKDSFLIKKDENFYSITGSFCDFELGNNEITVSYDGKNKQIQRNHKIYKTISDYVGLFNVVTFAPDDLNLIKGTPFDRRKFFDINISQFNKEYLIALMNYKKILKQRNEYLKQEKIDLILLDVLSSSLIKEATKIIQIRETFVAEINKYIEIASLDLTSGVETVKFIYEPDCLKENLVEMFEKKRQYDLLTKTTNVGPARDDFKILINDDDSARYGSQGQIKTAVLAVKLAIVDYLSIQKRKVLVILDDVFSELDFFRQMNLLKLINNDKQIFITTTSINNIPQEIVSDSKIIELGEKNKYESME